MRKWPLTWKNQILETLWILFAVVVAVAINRQIRASEYLQYATSLQKCENYSTKSVQNIIRVLLFRMVNEPSTCTEAGNHLELDLNLDFNLITHS